MALILKILIYLCLWEGVRSVHLIPWLRCQFTDEHVFVKNNFTETKAIHREAMLRFGQKGDPAVNPNAITFLLTGSKLDLRKYLEEVEADQLKCVLHRYSTDGNHVQWPVQEAQGYNYWFSCTLTHKKGLFNVTAFLRQPSDQPAPGKHDYHSWPVIADGAVLTVTVALLIKTQTPLVKTALRSQPKLHCQFVVDHKGAAYTLEWHQRRHGRRMKLFSHTGHSGLTDGTGVELKALSEGDASYTLPITSMSSEGTFICSVSVAPVIMSLDINLQIEERPEVIINVGPVLSLEEGETQKVVCEARNYYPLDVEMNWYAYNPKMSNHNGDAAFATMLRNTRHTSHKQNKDGTYSLSAFFYPPASLRHLGTQFTCNVFHQSLTVPIRRSFILHVEDPVKWMFIFSVVFSGVTLSLLWYLMRRLRSARRRAATNLPH